MGKQLAAFDMLAKRGKASIARLSVSSPAEIADAVRLVKFSLMRMRILPLLE
jgi:hypothetical protein